MAQLMMQVAPRPDRRASASPTRSCERPTSTTPPTGPRRSPPCARCGAWPASSASSPRCRRQLWKRLGIWDPTTDERPLPAGRRIGPPSGGEGVGDDQAPMLGTEAGAPATGDGGERTGVDGLVDGDARRSHRTGQVDCTPEARAEDIAPLSSSTRRSAGEYHVTLKSPKAMDGVGPGLSQVGDRVELRAPPGGGGARCWSGATGVQAEQAHGRSPMWRGDLHRGAGQAAGVCQPGGDVGVGR